MKKILLLSVLAISALSGCSHTAPEKAPTATQIPVVDTTPVVTPAVPEKAPAKSVTVNAPAVKPVQKPASITVSMDSGNFFFKPNVLKAKVNQPVTVNFTNSGFHTFVIDELGVKVSLQGATGTGSFTPTKVGTFQFYCDVGPHKSMGMFGTLTVTE